MDKLFWLSLHPSHDPRQVLLGHKVLSETSVVRSVGLKAPDS